MAAAEKVKKNLLVANQKIVAAIVVDVPNNFQSCFFSYFYLISNGRVKCCSKLSIA